MMNRRQFAGSLTKGVLAFLVFSSSILTGCNAVSDLEAWIPVALTAVSQIVKLLGPAVPAPISAAITIIQAAFAALLTAIQNYKAGSGVLADIASAIAAVESAFQSFFATLGVPSVLVSTIEGLAAIIISTIQAFSEEIGPAPPATVAINGKAVPVTPKKRSAKQFREAWNAQCTASGHPEAQI
jgi:hypothetical protein